MTDSITVFLSGVMLFLVKLVVVWSGGNIATRDSSSHSKVHRRCSLVIAGLVLAWFCYSFITRSQLINYRAREIKLNLNQSASILTYFSPTLNQISIVHLYSRVTPSPPRYLQGRAAMWRWQRAEYASSAVWRQTWPAGPPTPPELSMGVTRLSSEQQRFTRDKHATDAEEFFLLIFSKGSHLHRC